MTFRVLVLALLSGSAMAEPCLHGAHLVSLHERAGFESITPGLYLDCRAYTVGALRNSYGQLSVYAGRTWHTADGRYALTVGGITGYRTAPVYPMVVPSMRWQLGASRALRLSYIPKPPTEGGSSALHLSFELYE